MPMWRCNEIPACAGMTDIEYRDWDVRDFVPGPPDGLPVLAAFASLAPCSTVFPL